MEIHGIDLSSLTHQKKEIEIPVVPNRVVHIDGDFLAYMVAYDDSKSIEDMRHNCDVKAEKIRKMSGAEKIQIHLTPKESNKGGRYDIAILKEYQTNRKNKPKPRYLHLIRAYMHDTFGGIQHVNCEADDGMAMAQYQAIAAGNRNLSVIATKDKDLTMVPGLQIDWETGEITDTKDDFGYIKLDDSKTSKKITGRGTKVFWCQLLRGDTADNISGLPLCCTNKYLTRGKHKACGPVLTYDIIAPLKSDKECFEVVKKLYTDYHNVMDDDYKLIHPFRNWRDGSIITPGKALVSEAQLLWMRRNHDYDDVLNWFNEKCK